MRWKNLFVLVAVVLVINLPPLHSEYQKHRLASSGRDVRAAVVAHRALGGDYFVSFSVPRNRPEQGDRSFTATARVDRGAYAAATASGDVVVRVLPGSTSVWRVTGEVTGHLGLYLVGAADLLLLLLLLLYLRFRPRLRPTLVLVAEEDLEACPPGAALDRLAGQRYVVCGEVETVEDDAVVLAVGDRRVRVLLDGHHNPVRPEQSACATGTMIA